jgi:RNA polymerase sigma-70 factor, ECF subfamily
MKPAKADTSTVSRAREGDADAWRELYNAHAGRLLLWLRKTPLGDPSLDHEDLAMESWTLAASRIADFDGDDDAFPAWLFTVARNHLMNAVRKAARRATYATAELPEQVDTVDHTLLIEHEELIREAIRQLPAREGEVITCIDVVDLDVATTASVLGISKANVRMARSRGLARLRKAGWAV